MGIKTELYISQLPDKYHNLSLLETSDGVSDSVYILGDNYILKYYEDSSSVDVDNEIALLNSLTSLSVPKVIDRFDINSKIAVIYSKIIGESIYIPTIKNIEEIGLFLIEFHKITKDKSNSNIKLFNSIEKTESSQLLEFYKKIESLELRDDGIIHGDLFVDNAKFKDGSLCGVYDFSDACVGDFRFDLAVVAISWCYDKDSINIKKVKTLLKSYKSQLSFSQFKLYIYYALLYYATTRYIHNREYRELIYRLEDFKW